MEMLSYYEQLASGGYAVIPGMIEPDVIDDVCEFIRGEGGPGAGTRRGQPDRDGGFLQLFTLRTRGPVPFTGV